MDEEIIADDEDTSEIMDEEIIADDEDTSEIMDYWLSLIFN